MTTEQRKEETRDIIEKIIVDWLKSDNENATYCAHLINEKFYSEIEARDKRAELYEYEVEALKRVVREYEAERRRLEEIIKAADEVIVFYDKISRDLLPQEEKALEKYRELKSKLPSGI